MKVVQGLKLCHECLGRPKVDEPNSATRYLVFVGRADTSAGCTDLFIAPGRLAGLVEGHMNRKNERTGKADLEP